MSPDDAVPPPSLPPGRFLPVLCARPNCRTGPSYTRSTEFRIDGYCSIDCRDTHELEERIESLAAEVERLKEENEKRESTCGHCGAEIVWKLGPLADRVRGLEGMLANSRQAYKVLLGESAAQAQQLAAALDQAAGLTIRKPTTVSSETYPTADAYERACAALHRTKDDLAAARAEVLEEVLKLIPGGDICDPQIIADAVRALAESEGRSP